MAKDARWLLLALNIYLQFEASEGLTCWVLKKVKKPKTQTHKKTLLCSNGMKIAMLRQASHRARHWQGRGLAVVARSAMGP